MKNFMKAIALISCSLCSPVQQGQTVAKNDSLAMYLAPRSSRGCVGDKNLIVDVLVVNEGSDEQSLDVGKYYAVLGFSTISNGVPGDNSSGGMSLMPDRIGGPPASRIVTLKPHEAYKTELSIPLSDPFFGHAGLYAAMPSITIGAVRKPASEKQGLIFELRVCK
jgi:hypothetical protein